MRVNESKGALFLDRDGVINFDIGYLSRKEDCIFIPGIFDLVKKAKQLGMYVFVMTNQAGIGRGYYSENDFESLSEWMNVQFKSNQGGIDQFFYCPHHPDFGLGEYKRECDCRKPKSGLFEQAKQKYSIDLDKSWMVGDKETDLIASHSAGVKGNVLLTGLPESLSLNHSFYSSVASLSEIKLILD